MLLSDAAGLKWFIFSLERHGVSRFWKLNVVAEWLFSFSGGCQRSSVRQDVPPGTKTKTDKWQTEGEQQWKRCCFFPGFLDFTCVFSDKRRWKSELHIRRHTMVQLGTIQPISQTIVYGPLGNFSFSRHANLRCLR